MRLMIVKQILVEHETLGETNNNISTILNYIVKPGACRPVAGARLVS